MFTGASIVHAPHLVCTRSNKTHEIIYLNPSKNNVYFVAVFPTKAYFRLPNGFHVIYSKIYTFNNSHETRNFTTMIKIQHKILPFVHKIINAKL